MTTEDISVHIFYHVDTALLKVAKHGNAKLYPSEVVTIGILFALKGGHFHAFYRWLKRDFDGLFAGLPHNVKLCKKGTWNDRMAVETSFSLLTVVCHAKKIHHRLQAYIEARLAYTVAMFNICLKLFHQLHPQESRFKMSIAEFSL